ncbi:MAG: DUF4276 family protein [Candidatus Sumerlaeota bacterium]|nr:DUF4276 family protein [Candidatus Sumerlaeota bacterium]
MSRLHIIVEGQTEEAFANRTLKNHLATLGVYADAHCVTTSRKHRKAHRGGLIKFAHLENDITRWIRQDSGADSYFTTMLDLYDLPNDFPEYDDARACATPWDRVMVLEAALAKQVNYHRFIPYIQLHEFEALLFADPRKIECVYWDYAEAINEIIKIGAHFSSPEAIDDGDQTAPSKRIIRHIPRYAYEKAEAGPRIAHEIGLDTLRGKCRHFNEWLLKLEGLAKKN